jgi:hypothetical protein
MYTPMRTRLALLTGMLVAVTSTVHAQGYPFSQRGTVSQRVAFTDITIEYGRPTARGRALFGALVPWDSIWHPGADSATQISVNRDITLEGKPLARGTYTAWLIPRATGAWTFILNRRTGIQHTPYPGADSDVLRLDVTPEQASHLETLTWLFPKVLRDEATLRFQWGTTGIDLHIKAAYRPAP